MAIERDIAQQGLLQIQRVAKAMGIEHLTDPPIKAFDHAIGLRCSVSREPMLNAQRLAKPVKFALPTGYALMRSKQRGWAKRSVPTRNAAFLHPKF